MKFLKLIVVGLMFCRCNRMNTNNDAMVDLVDTVICNSYLFVGDSIVEKSSPALFVFQYDKHGRLRFYSCNNSKSVRINDKILAGLWQDIICMPLAPEDQGIDSVVPQYDDYWKRMTNMDFSNPNGWVCSGCENTTSEYRVNTLIEYYPSYVVFDTFGYTHGVKDLPKFIVQKRSYPNGISQIITYKVSYKNTKQPNTQYFDTMQYRVPYLNGHLPSEDYQQDNPDEIDC